MEEERYYDEYEIDLREYIMLLWDNKWFIIGLLIVAVLLAGLVSQYVMEPTYETEATIYAPFFELINDQKLNQNDYLSFFKKPELESDIIAEFGLKKDNLDYSTNNLDKKLNINSSDSNIVTLTITDSKPEKAKAILSYWIAIFQNEVNSFIEENNNAYIDKLEASMTSRDKQYEDIQNELAQFKKKSNVELLRKKLQNKENMLVGSDSTSGIEEKIVDLNSKIRSYKAEYKEITSQLEKTDEFTIMEKYLDSKSIKLLQKNLPQTEGLDELTVKEQILNDQYIKLVGKKNDFEQKLASAQSELELLQARQKNLEEEISLLQEDVAEKERKFERLKESEKSAQGNYQSAEKAYSKAEQLLSSKSYQISVINSPVVPQTSVSPNTKLNLAIAGVLALMLGVFIVFFREFLKEEDEQKGQSV